MVTNASGRVDGMTDFAERSTPNELAFQSRFFIQSNRYMYVTLKIPCPIAQPFLIPEEYSHY